MGWRDNGSPGCVRRAAETAFACAPAPLRCSGFRPASQLVSLTAFVPLRQGAASQSLRRAGTRAGPKSLRSSTFQKLRRTQPRHPVASRLLPRLRKPVVPARWWWGLGGATSAAKPSNQGLGPARDPAPSTTDSPQLSRPKRATRTQGVLQPARVRAAGTCSNAEGKPPSDALRPRPPPCSTHPARGRTHMKPLCTSRLHLKASASPP